MTRDLGSMAHRAARAMFDAFASVGVKTLDLTVTTRQGQKVRFQRGVQLLNMRHIMPAVLDGSAELQHNVIVRPHGPDVVFIQLDDLSADAIERVRPAAFIVLETSPKNYQAWIAMAVAEAGEDLARQLRKGAGADTAASGATRVAGSRNFKDKYAPDFPRVRITQTTPGRTASKEELVRLGLVCAGEQRAPALPARFSGSRSVPKRWPSYRRCVEGAPPTRDRSRPDISRADFTWCMIAIDWGWSAEETATRLMDESPKAHENGEWYAFQTARRAAAAIDRRRPGSLLNTLARSDPASPLLPNTVRNRLVGIVAGR